MPWGIFKEGENFCVHKLNADGGKGEQVACHDTQAEAEAQRAALYANVQEVGRHSHRGSVHTPDFQAQEFRGTFTDVLAITELRGTYPSVPIAADVDYEGLIAEDARAGTQPVFITVPIGKAGVTSGNKRHYDDAFLQELERQTLANRPIGLMGHLSETERATSFPPEAVHWVGALREGDTLWGKGYIPPGPIRDRIQRYKHTGKSIATSIDAWAEGVWDEALKATRMLAKTLRLNQIDLAPADRAGIADLARVPLLTTEMQDEPDVQQEPEMDKLQVINELTAADARLLPEPVRAAILETVQAPPEVAQMEALREALSLDDKADVVSVVTEMRRTQEAQAKAAVTARINELAADKEKGIQVESARPLIVELVQARSPATVQEAESAYAEVVAQPHVTEMLKAHVQAAQGPNQRIQGQNNGGEPKYFKIPPKENA